MEYVVPHADGNAETDDSSNGPGTMEAVYFGSAKGGLNHGGAGTGPWIMADLEAGLWGSDVVESPESSVHHEFGPAMVKGGSGPAPVSDTAPTQDMHRQTPSLMGVHACMMCARPWSALGG